MTLTSYIPPLVRYAEERQQGREELSSTRKNSASEERVIPIELKGAVPGTQLPEHKVCVTILY